MTYTRRLLRLLPPLAILAACAPAARTRTSVPPPAPAADASAADDEWVERTLAGLSLREKVGQMVMPWVGADYTAVDSRQFDALREWVEGEGIGGVVMSVGLPHSYAAKLNALQSIARVPLLVASDMENGPGMRMAGIYSFPHLLPQGGGTDFPPLMALGAAGSDSLAYALGRVTAREARAVGVHVTFGPVLDVNSNPANPIINTRSFGEDPHAVARFAAAYTRGVRAGGLLAAGKHFPGHGDTHTDSHIDLPSIDADRARLDAVELVPFAAAVRAGIDGMLVGHIAVPRVTSSDRLASLSPQMTDGLLRRELGFQGLVFTDAMNMGALTRRYGQGQAALLAIEAGADMLLQPTDIPGTIDAVVRAVEAGRIPMARIDQSVRRVLAAKSKAGIPRRGPVDPAAAAQAADSPENRALAAEVARRSITLVRDRRGLVPLAAGARRILSVVYADRGSPGGAFARGLGAGGRRVETARASASTTAARYAELRRLADSADVVVVSAYVTPREYQGTVEVPAAFAQWVQAVEAAGRPVVVVSFGSPYLLRSFPAVGAYLVAWGSAGVSQEAAADAILGRAAIGGRLPVSLPGHPRGSGVSRPASTGR
jgi:beta-N-acetylhexosaminidase